MKKLNLFLVATVFFIATLIGCADASIGNTQLAHANSLNSTARKRLRAFRSEQEMKHYFRQLAKEQKIIARREQGAVLPQPSVAPQQQAGALGNTAATTMAAKSAPADDKESVTNVQHAGVDEGGIVKLHGDHLVMLRRGLLFTVAIGDGALKPISTADAFGFSPRRRSWRCSPSEPPVARPPNRSSRPTAHCRHGRSSRARDRRRRT